MRCVRYTTYTHTNTHCITSFFTAQRCALDCPDCDYFRFHCGSVRELEHGRVLNTINWIVADEMHAYAYFMSKSLQFRMSSSDTKIEWYLVFPTSSRGNMQQTKALS